MSTVSVARYKYELPDAKAVIAGYCFGRRSMGWSPRSDRYGEAPAAEDVARWAYRSYDCMPRSPGNDFVGIDLMVAAGINGRPGAKAVLGMQAVSREVGECLTALEGWPDINFWVVSEEEIGSDPPRDSAGWHIARAWWLLMKVPGVGPAITYKTLHHKRPHLFPLLDNKTLDEYEKGRAWSTIHAELNNQCDQFDSLESWFAELADQNSGTPLTRLRLHDILLWCKVTGNDSSTAEAGRSLPGIEL